MDSQQLKSILRFMGASQYEINHILREMDSPVPFSTSANMTSVGSKQNADRLKGKKWCKYCQEYHDENFGAETNTSTPIDETPWKGNPHYEMLREYFRTEGRFYNPHEGK